MHPLCGTNEERRESACWVSFAFWTQQVCKVVWRIEETSRQERLFCAKLSGPPDCASVCANFTSFVVPVECYCHCTPCVTVTTPCVLLSLHSVCYCHCTLCYCHCTPCVTVTAPHVLLSLHPMCYCHCTPCVTVTAPRVLLSLHPSVTVTAPCVLLSQHPVCYCHCTLWSTAITAFYPHSVFRLLEFRDKLLFSPKTTLMTCSFWRKRRTWAYVISGFRRGVREIFALLECYSA